MTDTMLIEQLNADRAAQIKMYEDELLAEIAGNDMRVVRAVARLARWAAVAPATLGALNVVGVL